LALIEKFNIKGTKHWRKKPDLCPYCRSDDISGVEILGAYGGDLFWECDDCHEFLLRFTKRTTEKHLQKTRGLHIDLDRWEELWEQLPN
jgi:transposase-like protein